MTRRASGHAGHSPRVTEGIASRLFRFRRGWVVKIPDRFVGRKFDSGLASSPPSEVCTGEET
jgi:hypothetical protein